MAYLDSRANEEPCMLVNWLLQFIDSLDYLLRDTSKWEIEQRQKMN